MTGFPVTQKLLFRRCINWNTPNCPNENHPALGLSIINNPNYFLLNDDSVKTLARICGNYGQFRKRP